MAAVVVGIRTAGACYRRAEEAVHVYRDTLKPSDLAKAHREALRDRWNAASKLYETLKEAEERDASEGGI
jgi:hypothetical protein